MILTCPHCATRYLLPAHTLAPDGRRVKCSNCSEIWHQLPDTEEMKENPGSGFEDIPEGVRPLPDGANLPTVTPEEGATSSSRARVMGYVAAAGIFFLIFGGLLVFEKSMIAKFPSTESFYVMFGGVEEDPVAQSPLTFAEIEAAATSAEGDNKISITGKIMNNSGTVQTVPMIEARIISDQGEVLERWHIRPPAQTIEDGNELSFSADYTPAAFDPAQDLNLGFITN